MIHTWKYKNTKSEKHLDRNWEKLGLRGFMLEKLFILIAKKMWMRLFLKIKGILKNAFFFI